MPCTKENTVKLQIKTVNTTGKVGTRNWETSNVKVSTWDWESCNVN